MGPFASGIGLLILVLALLFTWLAVAVFVSPDLASFMGLGIMGMWAAFFLPLGFIREMIWQSRQKKIIDQAMSGQPVAYQAGTALPPPTMPSASGAVGGGSSGSLMVVDQPAGGNSGAIDIYRELPQLPQLEPRPHASAFKRSLVLPIVGFFMFVGAQNDAWLHSLLESRGMTKQVAVDWDKLKIPPEYADQKDNMVIAARLTLRRELSCNHIIGGRIAPLTQFTQQSEQAEQMANEQFVYEFDCAGMGEKPQPYLAWVTPADLDRSSIDNLSRTFDAPPQNDEALKSCETAAKASLAPQGATLQAVILPTIDRARMPYPDFLRIYGNYTLIKADGTKGVIGLSCWAGNHGTASVRFSRPN